MLALILSCAGPADTAAAGCWSRDDADCDGVVSLWDCDDNDPGVGLPDRYYPDNDADGYGVWLGAAGHCTDPGAGWVACLGLDWDLNPCPEMDCNDNDPDVGPCADY